MKQEKNRPPNLIKDENARTPLPPRELIRPRNGVRTGDALGVDKFSGPDGGGKSPDAFVPLVDDPREVRLNTRAAIDGVQTNRLAADRDETAAHFPSKATGPVFTRPGRSPFSLRRGRGHDWSSIIAPSRCLFV